MESVLTVRLDASVKAEATAVMERLGTTPSRVVRSLFDYAVQHEALPPLADGRPSEDEVVRRIRAFDQCHTLRPLTMSDEELREERLRGRYELDA
uniref:Translation repressor RelB n=1 Tax=Muribaculaceae bacterium Z82 TaxID=2304548 RepID=A0A7C9JR10_9BACT